MGYVVFDCMRPIKFNKIHTFLLKTDKFWKFLLKKQGINKEGGRKKLE